MTTVEYALAVAMVAVFSVAGVTFLQNRTGSELARKSTSGTPDLEVGATTTIPPSSTSTVSPTTPPTSSAPGAVAVSITGSATPVHGNKWIASVVVVVTDTATGATVPSVTLQGSWVGQGSGSCVTQAGGSCPITLEKDLNNGVASVTFAAGSVTGVGVLPPASYPSVTINQP